MGAPREAVETAANDDEQEKGVQAAGEDGPCLSGRQARQIRRRGLLAAAIALGAGAVAKIPGANRAEAADGGNIMIGQINVATSGTALQSDNSNIGFLVQGSPTRPNRAIAGFTVGAGKIGVHGRGTGIGVLGYNESDTVGVEGEQGSTGGVGVRGVNVINGTGIKGVSNTGFSESPDGDGSGTGVHGKSNSGSGVLGQSTSGFGVLGSSTSNVGVYGTANTGTGVYGTSNTYVGVYGNSTGGAGKRAAQFDGDVLINGSSTVTGLKSAAVPHPDGTLRKLYSLESPESYFEDFGKAPLEKGVAAVPLDPDFAVLVQTGDYNVFLTPNGDCRGLYVSSMGPQGFEVRELQGGTSSLSFSYRVVAKRRDVVAPRLEKLERERVKAFGLKQYAAPAVPTIPPEQVFPAPAIRLQDSARPGVPLSQPQPGSPQVPLGRR